MFSITIGKTKFAPDSVTCIQICGMVPSATDLLFKHSIKQCPQCKQRAYSLVKLYWETESPPPPQLDAELPGDTIELQQIIKKNAAFVERLKSQISDLESTSAELEKRLSVANSEAEQCRVSTQFRLILLGGACAKRVSVVVQVKLFEERKRGKRYKLGLEDLERQNTRLSLQLDKVRHPLPSSLSVPHFSTGHKTICGVKAVNCCSSLVSHAAALQCQ